MIKNFVATCFIATRNETKTEIKLNFPFKKKLTFASCFFSSSSTLAATALHHIQKIAHIFCSITCSYKYMQRDTVSSLIGPVINEIPIFFFSFFIYCIAIEWKYHINMYIEDYLILLYYIFFARLCILS